MRPELSRERLPAWATVVAEDRVPPEAVQPVVPSSMVALVSRFPDDWNCVKNLQVSPGSQVREPLSPVAPSCGAAM
ncbi:hypothetical protein GCM10018952_37890 [Streptosporangium vulgare]